MVAAVANQTTDLKERLESLAQDIAKVLKTLPGVRLDGRLDGCARTFRHGVANLEMQRKGLLPLYFAAFNQFV